MRRAASSKRQGGRAAIGALTQIQQIVDGEAGTQVVSEMEER